MDKLCKGWFSELSDAVVPGQCLSLKVKEIIHQEKSQYQDILIFQSTTHGRVLVLDGMIQLTERDEFCYQEMISFLPLNCHPSPKHVLIIGGGDGGVVREVSKHPSVESITLCDIDASVIEASKTFLPFMSEGFKSPKLTVNVCDGYKFLQNVKEKYDVVITDSSDPVGPAEILFKKEYYEAVRDALKPGGVLCSQGESIFLHLDLIKEMVEFSKELFPSVGYAYTSIPTYPSGQIGFLICSKQKDMNFREPVTEFSNEESEAMKLRYYSPRIHRAAFDLPAFAVKELMLQ